MMNKVNVCQVCIKDKISIPFRIIIFSSYIFYFYRISSTHKYTKKNARNIQREARNMMKRKKLLAFLLQYFSTRDIYSYFP